MRNLVPRSRSAVRFYRPLFPQLAILALAFVPANAQLPEKVLHAHAGTVVVAEGVVFTDAASADPDHPGPQRVPEIRTGQSVGTRDGRVEILLGTDIYLRLDHDTTITLENDTLVDPTITLEQGTALVEVVFLPKSIHPQIHVRDTVTTLDKPGLYRFDADANSTASEQNRLMVFGGNAEVISNATPETASTHSTRVRRDETLDLAATALSEPVPFYRVLWKTNPFHVWCADRSYLIYRNESRHFDRGVQRNWGYTRTRFSTLMENINFDALRPSNISKDRKLGALERKTNAQVEAKVATKDAEALAKAHAAEAAENAAKHTAKSPN